MTPAGGTNDWRAADFEVYKETKNDEGVNIWIF